MLCACWHVPSVPSVCMGGRCNQPSTTAHLTACSLVGRMDACLHCSRIARTLATFCATHCFVCFRTLLYCQQHTLHTQTTHASANQAHILLGLGSVALPWPWPGVLDGCALGSKQFSFLVNETLCGAAAACDILSRFYVGARSIIGHVKQGRRHRQAGVGQST